MSLDTVLQIGKAFRQSADNLKYFRYVEPCPLNDMDGKGPVCITVPVREDFSFDWDNIRLTPENQRDKLYYLKFKTADSDTLMKYIFGDIYYGRSGKLKKDNTVEINDTGYYRLENPSANGVYKFNSFQRGESDYLSIIEKHQDVPSSFVKFHDSFAENMQLIESMLRYASSIIKRLEKPFNSSFLDYIKDNELLYNDAIIENYNSLSRANREKLEVDKSVLTNNTNIKKRQQLFALTNAMLFIHFDFPEHKHWYEFSEVMNLLTETMLSEFVDREKHGFVFKKTLYKTLCSGDAKNDIQFPDFSNEHKHKAKSFDAEDIQHLFYAIDYTNKGRPIPWTDIKLIVLPRGNNLTSDDYERFSEKKDENSMVAANNENNNDVLFDFSMTKNSEITSFDLVFCKKGGMTSPDKDLIEISGVEKSQLRLIMERIHRIANNIETERRNFINTDKELFPLKIENSYRNVLGNPQTDNNGKVSFKPNPKFQSHLLKVLPQIYTSSYFQDEVLLSAFIQNVEYSVRSGDSRFNFLKFDLKFLLLIQNSINNKYMEIIKSESYQVGYKLGELAKNISLEINSFEKNYVGTLTRRVGTLADFVKLKNDIEQKLIMHDKTKYTFQTSYELAQKIKDFGSSYDKEECAFGFLEAYFKPLPKKETQSTDSNNLNT